MDQLVSTEPDGLAQLEERVIALTGVSVDSVQACTEAVAALRTIADLLRVQEEKRQASYFQTLHSTRALIEKLPEMMQTDVRRHLAAQAEAWSTGISVGTADAFAKRSGAAADRLDAAQRNALHAVSQLAQAAHWLSIWPIVVAAMVGLVLGVAGTFFFFGAPLQRTEAFVEAIYTRQVQQAGQTRAVPDAKGGRRTSQ